MLTRASTSTLRAVTRTPVLRQQARFAHVENKVDQAIPGGSGNRTGFKVTFAIYSAVGLALPYIATYISFNKAAGAQ